MNIITFDNILSFLEYNRCILCDTQTDLHECDSCKDLFCIKCDNIYDKFKDFVSVLHLVKLPGFI